MAIYLTGSVTDVRSLLDNKRLGYMNTPSNRHTMNNWIWAADNGCYGKNYVGDDKWFAWLESFTDEAKSLCLFATAPDVVGDASSTLARSLPWLSKIRSIRYKAAFVAQDGLRVDSCPWDEFDALFIGGTTDWKLSKDAADLMSAGKQRGKWIHVGRVNSWKRYQGMACRGADSVDGTFIAFGPKVNAPKLMSWIDAYAAQGFLWDGEQE